MHMILPEKIDSWISQRHQDREERKALHPDRSPIVTFAPLVRNVEEDSRVDLKPAGLPALVDDPTKET